MFLFEAGLEIFGIRLYAICIMTGILLALLMGLKEGKKLGLSSDFIYTGVLIIVPLCIIGARLWFVINSWGDGWTFTEILGLDGGGLSGLAIHGGIIVAVISVIVYCKHHKVKVFRVFDILAPGLLIGQACGRWGNFFNKELYGPVVENVELFETILPKFITENMFIDGALRHPAFLYESLLNTLGLVIILIARRKFKKLETGDILGFYITWYGVVRVFTELLRMKGDPNDPLRVGGVPVSLVLSIIFIVVGIAFIIAKRFIKGRENYQEVLKNVEENRFDTVIFDLDGTLLDTKPLIDRSFYFTFQHHRPGYEPTEEELQSFFGPTLYESFSRYSDDEAEIAEMIKTYRKFNIEGHTTEHVKTFDGAKSLIKTLKKKGYKLAIVSSKKKDVVELGLNLYDLTKYFDVIIGGDDVKNHKPHPEGILKAMDVLKPKRNVLYVGDNPSDILAGQNANVRTCDVMYSALFEECEKLNPTYCTKDLLGILKILGE